MAETFSRLLMLYVLESQARYASDCGHEVDQILIVTYGAYRVHEYCDIMCTL